MESLRRCPNGFQTDNQDYGQIRRNPNERKGSAPFSLRLPL